MEGSCERGIESSGSINKGNFLNSLGHVSSSARTQLHGVIWLKITALWNVRPGRSIVTFRETLLPPSLG